MLAVRPMLAVSLKNINKAGKELRYPFLASSKIDGVRVICTENGPQTRSGMMIPNNHIRDMLSEPELIGLDGEVTVGPVDAHDLCARTVSAVNSFEGHSDFNYWIFDDFSVNRPALQRYSHLITRIDVLSKRFPFLKLLPQRLVLNEAERLRATEEMSITEGIMLKRTDCSYKYGRSTPSSQELVKDKPFEDAEAVIIGFIQGTTNENVLERSPLGFAKRATNMENISLVETMGSLRCKAEPWGEFNVSISPLSHQQRKELWDNRHKALGKIITFTYLPVGSLESPRSPQLKFFRPFWDM